MEEVLEDKEVQKTVVPQAVKTLSIFAYIGNGFWGLVIFILMILTMTSIDTIERIVGGSLGEQKGVLIVTFLIMLATCVLPIIGCIKMSKGYKTGFYMYVAANGIWTLLNIIAATPQNIFVGLISLGFIIGFGSQLKHLK
ncbi:MAG: hypothetical protein JNJ99_16970 [Crocinitomicaceae bacterium]|nr:hypothetical protein [Crocinitomicaceae bacterium]